MPAAPSDPSPLGEATEGFVDLTRWFVGLVGDQLAAVGRGIDDGSFDVDAAAGALARAAAFPLIGWASLLNEVFDAASIVSTPLLHHRPITSAVFRAPGLGTSRQLVLDGPLTNGFGEELAPPARSAPDSPVAIVPATLGPEEAEFTLEAPNVPPEAVGVFSGRLAVVPSSPHSAQASDLSVDVWLVVP